MNLRFLSTLILTFGLLIPYVSFGSNQCSKIFIAEKKGMSQAVSIAAGKLLAYEASASKHILEREYLLDSFLVALLAKEHILLIGPPGNAKTKMAKLLLSNIVDAKTGQVSLYAMQMNKEITLSDTHGSINFKDLSNGIVHRNYEEGLLGAKLGFIDEAFDIRPGAFRNIMDILADRSHSQGTKHHKGITELIIAATNKTLPEVYDEFNNSEQPRALIDRYAFVIYIPKEMMSIKSDRKIFSGQQATEAPVSKVTFQDIDVLRDLIKQVEVPDSIADLAAIIHYRLTPEFEAREVKAMEQYREKIQNGEHTLPPFRASKYLSPRTLKKSGNALKSIVVLDYIRKNGERELTATLEDLSRLRAFYQINGPATKDLDAQLARAVKPYEQEQIKAVQTERQIVNPMFDSVLNEFNTAKKTNLKELVKIAAGYEKLSVVERRKFADTLKGIYQQGLHGQQSTSKEDLSMNEVVALSTMEDVRSLAKVVWKEKSEKIIQDWERELTGPSKRITAAKKRKDLLRYRDYVNAAPHPVKSARAPKTKGSLHLVNRTQPLDLENVTIMQFSSDSAEIFAQTKNEEVSIGYITPGMRKRLWSGRFSQVAYFRDEFMGIFAANAANQREAYLAPSEKRIVQDSYPLRNVVNLQDGTVVLFSSFQMSTLTDNTSGAVPSGFHPRAEYQFMVGGVIPQKKFETITLEQHKEYGDFLFSTKDFSAQSEKKEWKIPEELDDVLNKDASNLIGARFLMVSDSSGILHLADKSFIVFKLGDNGLISQWRHERAGEIDISADGRLLAVADGEIVIFSAAELLEREFQDQSSPEPLASFTLENDASATGIKFSPDGQRLLISTDKQILIYDIQEGAQ